MSRASDIDRGSGGVGGTSRLRGRAVHMSADSRLLRSLQLQGQICAGMGSPMYGDVSDRVAADVEAGGVFAAILSGHENDSGRLAVPLRLLGGLHRLALDGRASGLRRWYPSTGGQWDAEAAWPEIALAASNHADQLRPPSISRHKPTKWAGPPR